MLDNATQKDYAKYRLERAGEDLDVARLLFDNGSWPLITLILRSTVA